MQSLDFYREAFLSFLAQRTVPKAPEGLYDPIAYILQLGGKRLRPVLTLVATELFEVDYNKALPAAMAVEVFHNFSLVHDDIMDEAPLRRGQPTVHEKWDINTGILSGDLMLINAYECFLNYEGTMLRALFELFNKTAVAVCEGQQYDVDFEDRMDVTLAEYLKMIEYKTAVLIAAALKMGAIVGEAAPKDQELIYEFGRNLGIAFQLQDDFLDAFGDPKTFGKQVGGDIIENKKTFLYLKAIEGSTPENKALLEQLFVSHPEDPTTKVATVKQIFESSGAMEATKVEIAKYTEKAFAALEAIEAKHDGKQLLQQFGEALMVRLS
ncbi:MAG: polyprenyl synthetase family protein [Bacteroidota bacterium]